MATSDDIDVLIDDILTDESTELSAEAKNVLHGARSTHPWAAGKSDWTRVLEVTGGLAGRRVHAQYHLRLERLRDRLAKKETKQT